MATMTSPESKKANKSFYIEHLLKKSENAEERKNEESDEVRVYPEAGIRMCNPWEHLFASFIPSYCSNMTFSNQQTKFPLIEPGCSGDVSSEESDGSHEVSLTTGKQVRVSGNSRSSSVQRKSRTAFTEHQLKMLEKRFERQKYLAVHDRLRLATKLHLTDNQIKTWYQNRRTKWKRKVSMNNLQTCQKVSLPTPVNRDKRRFQRMAEDNSLHLSNVAITDCNSVQSLDGDAIFNTNVTTGLNSKIYEAIREWSFVAYMRAYSGCT